MKEETKKYKVGDKIVNFGQVYRVFKIQKEIMYYRPYFKRGENQDGIICSVPMKNIKLTQIRRPASKKG